MHTVPQIPGIELEVYKEDRLLQPEEDGCVGQLFSGSATIMAIVDPNADPTFAYLRDGQDHYSPVVDWVDYVNQSPGDRMNGALSDFLRRQKHKARFLQGRLFDGGSKVYGLTMSLHRNHDNHFNTVHYPENMIAFAQYVRDGAGRLTGRVHVWEVALVSQFKNFFLTVHQHYNIPACHVEGKTRLCFPRLEGHPLLARLLRENAPRELPTIPTSDVIPLERDKKMESLGRREAIVESWYAPRNMGSLITAQGTARVHFTDVPMRPRLRFLKEGEMVKFADLRKPSLNVETEFRKARMAQFKLQACGIEVAS